MLHKRIEIWKENYNGQIQGEAVMTTYIHDNSPEIDTERKRPAILVLPGGGYGGVSDRESEPVAVKFFSAGFNVFVLKYEVAPAVCHPQPLYDATRAMWIIRENAEEWFVSTDHIAICGFSAGGHLAASLGVFWEEEYLAKNIGMPKGMNKPDAMILNYPVISSGEHAHRGSFQNLLGLDASDELLERMSIEKQVNQSTPPAFIWHTFDDTCVPVENSLLMASSMRKNNIPFELHIFDKGSHGLSLCNYETSKTSELVDEHVGRWTDLCIEWLKRQFEMTKGL